MIAVVCRARRVMFVRSLLGKEAEVEVDMVGEKAWVSEVL